MELFGYIHQLSTIFSCPSSSIPCQIPQPTCYWKWVGCKIPLKQENLTLKPCSSAILRYSMLNGCFFSSYRSQISDTNVNFHISPSAAVAGHSCHPPNPHFVTRPILISFSHDFLLVFLISTFCISHFHLHDISKGIFFSCADQ